MTKLFVDSSVWVEYLAGSERAKQLQKYFDNNELFTTSVSVAEVVAKSTSKGFSVTTTIDALRSISTIVDVDLPIASEAGAQYPELRKTRPKIALSDVILIVAARKFAAKLITFDYDFHKINDVI